MGDLHSEIKAEVQYDGVPLICLGLWNWSCWFFFWSWCGFFLHFLNENVLLFDKENYFSFQISPSFNKRKKKKRWIWNNGKRRGQWISKVINTFVSETWISNYPPESYSALSCLGKTMLQGLKAGSTGGLLPPSWMEAQETCLKCISSHPSICLRDKRWPPSNSFSDLLSKVF